MAWQKAQPTSQKLVGLSPLSPNRSIPGNYSEWLGALATLALPFVLAPQQRLVSLDLRFDVAEGILATRQHIFAAAGGVQRARWKRERQGTGLLLRPLIPGEYPVQLNEIRLVTSQEPSQLVQTTHQFSRNSLLRINVLVAYRNVHGCTHRKQRGIWQASDAVKILHRMMA